MMAGTIESEESRASLVAMAQTWLRLAEEQEALPVPPEVSDRPQPAPVPPEGLEQPQPAVQQQQQKQPDDDGDKR